MKHFCILIVLSVLNVTAFSQVSHCSDLYKTIKEKDSLLFEIGFNTCDISQFENLLSERFEFFHDQGGITATKSDFIVSIRDGLCKMDYKAKRVLDKKSMEVYPLYNNGVLYGGIQTADHTFYAIEGNKPEYITSIAKFTHVWILENNEWRLVKGLSYDHRTQNKN